MILKHPYILTSIVRRKITNMIKVLIAEDEYLVRVGLRQSIPWYQNGFILLDDVVDGSQAYKQILKEKPDILILDIRMPKLNGLELLELLKKDNIELKTIIISCMDDFETVRSAIKYGVVDFMKKEFLDPNELLELLLAVKSKLTDKNEIDTFKQKNYPEKMICNLLNQEYFDLDDKTGFFVFIKILEQKDYIYNKIICEICIQLLKNFGIESASYIIYENMVLVNLLSDANKLDMTQKLKTQVSNILNVPITTCSIGYWKNSTQAKSLYNIPLIKNIFFWNYKEETVVIEELPKFSDSFKLESHINFDELKYAIEIQDISKINNIINNFTQTFMYNKGCCSSTIKTATLEVSEYILNFVNIDVVKKTSMQTLIMNSDNLKCLIENFKNLANYFTSQLTKKSSQKYSLAVKSTLEFIETNKYNYISLNSASDHVRLTQPYLSSLFKKEIGQNLVSYIRNYKMELAKSLLRDQLFVYEVAEKLGYQNSNYFARIFKKTTGISPDKYREINR